MDVPAAPVGALAPAVAAPPPHIFDLGRLPCELRMHIIRDAALESNHIHATVDDGRARSGALLLVSREFHAVAAPLHWDTISLSRPGTIGLGAVRALINTVLPRYGVHVKSAYLACEQLPQHWIAMTAPSVSAVNGSRQYDPATGQRLLGSTTSRLVARVVLNMPNLAAITMGTTIQDVVASSPHLASLTRLIIDASGYTLIASNLASIINHSPNLVEVSILHVVTPREQDHHLLVKALASRQALTTLTLDCLDFLNDSTGPRWTCPLTSINLVSYDPVRGDSTTTFLSYFSDTLLHLHLSGNFSTGWFHPQTSAVPVTLRRLVTLSVTPTTDPLLIGNVQNAIRVPSLFDESPIEEATLLQGTWTQYYDPIAPMLLDFVFAHQDTLKILRTTLRDKFEFNHGSQLPGLIELVHRGEITLETKLWGDMHSEDCSIVDEEEESAEYLGDDDETAVEEVPPRDWMDDIASECEKEEWERDEGEESEEGGWDWGDPLSHGVEFDDIAETVFYGFSRTYPRYHSNTEDGNGSGSDGDWVK